MEDTFFLDSIDPDLYPHSTKIRPAQNDDSKALLDLYKKILDGDDKSSSLLPRARIYRVPENLRRLNKRAYTPGVIAIGPLHRKDDHLQPMQKVKMFYTRKLLSRLTNEFFPTELLLLQECVEKMKECVDEAKRFYAAEVTVEENEMVEMMMVDGCFILELLYFCQQSKGDEQNTTNAGETSGCSKSTNGGVDGSGSSIPAIFDPIFNSARTESIVKQDLLLLENQIPFFVLKKLFKLTVAKIPNRSMLSVSLEDYVRWYFGDILTPEDEDSGSKTKSSCCSPGDFVLCVSGESGHTDEMKQKESASNANDPYHHILHLLHGYYGPHDLQNQPGKTELTGFKRKYHSSEFSEYKLSASDLHYIGVKFLPTKENKPFTVEFKQRPDIFGCFSRLEVYIPPLLVHKHTELFLRNLIAFEQSNSAIQGAFTTYAKVMGMLVTSEKDVQMLMDVGIIHNYLGTDEDVYDLFNKLSVGVNVEGDYYSACQREIKYYRRHCWPRTMAYWRRLVFGSTWSVIAFAFGIITSVITVAQFVKEFRK